MQNLNFDDGLKSFAINGDERRVIRFNPADPDLIIRYDKARKRIAGISTEKLSAVKLDGRGQLLNKEDEDGYDEAVEALKEVNQTIREALKDLFIADVYDIVFAGMSPFAGATDGRFVFETFMEAVKPILENGISEYRAASEKRMEKYTKGYK